MHHFPLKQNKNQEGKQHTRNNNKKKKQEDVIKNNFPTKKVVVHRGNFNNNTPSYN